MQISEVFYLMQICLNKAKLGTKKQEVPIGCLIYNKVSKKIITIQHNLVEKTKNKINHAEIIAINDMYAKNNSKYIGQNLVLFTTLEPCLTCFTCILSTGITEIYYSLNDYKYGAFNGINNFISVKNNNIKIYSNILEQESLELLQSFFIKIRK